MIEALRNSIRLPDLRNKLLYTLLILMIYPNVSLTGDDWFRMALIFVMFLLYLSVFFTLGLFISTRTSRSATSFLLLLFI